MFKHSGALKNGDGPSAVWQRDGPTLPAPPTTAGDEAVVTRPRVASLTRRLFSLEEPWRSRFLRLVANLATRWGWGRRRPSCEEVAAWLLANPALYRQTRRLLKSWPSRRSGQSCRREASSARCSSAREG